MINQFLMRKSSKLESIKVSLRVSQNNLYMFNMHEMHHNDWLVALVITNVYNMILTFVTLLFILTMNTIISTVTLLIVVNTVIWNLTEEFVFSTVLMISYKQAAMKITIYLSENHIYQHHIQFKITIHTIIS